MMAKIYRRDCSTSIPPEEERVEIKRLDTALCKMVNLRWTVDKRLKKEKMAEYWPLFKVWQTTEAVIVNAVEFSETLQDDGCTEEESIKKLLSNLGLPQDTCADLVSYLQLRLKVIDPEYLALGMDLLNQALTLARTAAALEVRNRKQDARFPPVEWLKEKIDYHELMDESIYEHVLNQNFETLAGTPVPVRKTPRYALLPSSKSEGRDWIRFQLRMRPNDEIWTFCGSLLANGTSLRGGVALFRDKKVIDYVETLIG